MYLLNLVQYIFGRAKFRVTQAPHTYSVGLNLQLLHD